MTDDGYRFGLLDFSDGEFDAVSRLLRTVFPKTEHLTPAYLKWQYLDNPDGRAVGCNAWAGDELVGHMTAVPMQGRVEGEAMPGSFMLNGAVAAGHRGRKLQSRISAAIFAEALAQGHVFCVGTGNRYSTIPLLTRFELVRPLEARLGFGLPARRAKRVRPSFERIWSPEALAWRLANPQRDYAVRRGGGGRSAVLAPAAPGVAAILHDPLDLPPNEARAGGPMRLWLGIDPNVDWLGSAFLPIPRALRPSPLNLVFKDLTGRGLLPDPARFTFRALDFDPY